MPTEDEILAEMQALAEAVSTDKSVTASNLNRTRTDVALSKANKDAAALSAGTASTKATEAAAATTEAVAAKDVVLAHVDGVVWYPAGWNLEDVFPIGASLEYEGSSYRALEENQAIEPGTEAADGIWLKILGNTPEVLAAKEAAEAAAVAAEADRVTVAADKATTLTATTLATQKAAQALSSEASAAGHDAAAAASAVSAAASATGPATYDSLAELEANTTALAGQVLIGEDAGQYRRLTPDDPDTDWVRWSIDTVPALGAVVAPVAGRDGPSIGWVNETDSRVAQSIVFDPDGLSLYTPHPDGRLRVIDAAGQWAAETAGRTSPSVGFLLGDGGTPAASVTLDEADGLLFVPAERGALLFPGRDGALRDDLSERGPSMGFLAPTDQSPTEGIAVDLRGHTLPTIGADGLTRWSDESGRWHVGAGPRECPSFGWPSLSDDAPIPVVETDHNGRPLASVGADGLPRWADQIGTWRVGAGPMEGPSIGFLTDRDIIPAPTVSVDHSGRGLASVGHDGVVRAPDVMGRWRSSPSATDGPSFGWLADDADSLAPRATLDEVGGIVTADAAGSSWLRVRYDAAPTGLVRVETPADGPQLVTGGTVLAIPPTRIPRGAGWLETPGVSFVSPDTTPATVSGEALTLRYGDVAWLSYQYVSDAVVTRVSDSEALEAGVDYSLDAVRGVLVGLVDTPDFAITVDFTGYPVRSDIVSVAPRTGLITLTTGDERPRTASMFIPDAPAGDVVLFRAFRFATGAELVPLWLYRRTINISRAPAIEADIAEQRRRARPHRALIEAKVRTSGTLRWGGEGDSTTALGGSSAEESNDAPNGMRQAIGYFQLYDNDARALIPVEDLGDGYGEVHHREGWNWRALKFLITAYGSSVSYRNWGINGTYSADTELGNGLYNQGHPDKLASIAADNLDIICYVPGMNELGESYTYGNVRSICEYHMDAGTLVILGTPARPNSVWNPNLLASWRETCNQIEQVADDLYLPCIKSRRALEPSCLAMPGIAEREVCDATVQNHPGVRELNAIGDLITEFL